MQLAVQLIQGADNQVVGATLLDLAQRHVNDFENLWRAQLRQYLQEDKYWDWIFKKRIALSDDNYESYAIEYEEQTQGLLFIETQRHRSQIEIGQQLVYVEALASAPWNRKAVQRPPQLRGVGTLLLNFARKRSVLSLNKEVVGFALNDILSESHIEYKSFSMMSSQSSNLQLLKLSSTSSIALIFSISIFVLAPRV